MTPQARPRGALFGVAYFVLAILGTLTYPMSSTPDFAGPPQEFVDFYLENSGRILGGNTLYLLASVLLLAFAANLQHHGRPRHRLAGGWTNSAAQLPAPPPCARRRRQLIAKPESRRGCLAGMAAAARDRTGE